MQSQQSEENNNNAHGDRAKGDDNTCRDYMRGVCNRGYKCKYYHPPGGGPVQMPDLAMICRDYQNGKCNRTSCKYLHMSNAEEKIYMQSGQLPPPRSDRRGGRPSYKDYGEEHTRAGKNDPVCKDFLNKVCKRGSNCKFRHVSEDNDYYGPPGYDYEPPRKRPRDGYNGYGGDDYLYQENESLRRKVSDLQKQISDLKGANEVLLEQNARLRNDRKGDEGDKNSRSYSASYNNSGYSQGAYNASSSGGYSGSSAYEGYTKFD